MNRTDLLNAFLPAREIDDPARFSGRRTEVRELADALRIEGSVPLIYGHRGLGKSSLALQVARIAIGDLELLDHLDSSSLAFEPDDTFVVFRVTCTHTTRDLNSLLQMMLNTVEADATAELARTSGPETRTGRATKTKLSMKFLEHERAKTYASGVRRESYESLSIEEKFLRVCDEICTAYSQPVLFVIDEVDRLPETEGLAAFLKAASSPDLKFLLVGIAGSHADLLSDHSSIERQLIPVAVDRMTDDELYAIIDNAEEHLARLGASIRFSPRARDRVTRMSSGFPWFVHVIGQAALVGTADDGRDEVLSGDIRDALAVLTSSRFAQKYVDQYQTAVRDSSQREMVLRLLALWDSADIPTAVVYPMARNQGVANPSVYRAHLTQTTYGAPLYLPAFQERGVLRFRDEMFKVYVRLRESLFANVDVRAEEEYENLLKS